MNRNYVYQGYMYIPHEKVTGDKYKIFHEIQDMKSGERMTADFTPYCFMSKIDFINFVNLGFPNRGGDVGPLSSDRLRKMKAAR